jgi:hypothetical protein
MREEGAEVLIQSPCRRGAGYRPEVGCPYFIMRARVTLVRVAETIIPAMGGSRLESL